MENRSPEREVVPGHLLRQPHSRNGISNYHSVAASRDGKKQNLSGTGKFNTKVFESMQLDQTDRNTWSKREVEWFTIEDRLIFKNNKTNVLDGSSSVIPSWIG